MHTEKKAVQKKKAHQIKKTKKNVPPKKRKHLYFINSCTYCKQIDICYYVSKLINYSKLL